MMQKLGKLESVDIRLLWQNEERDFTPWLAKDATNSGTALRLRILRPQHWYPIAVGRSKFSINLTTNTQTKKVGCELYIRGKNAKKAYSLLEVIRDDIDQELGELSWQELPEGQDCRIIKYRTGNTKNRNDWPEIHHWLKEQAEAFYSSFSSRVKKLDLDNG